MANPLLSNGLASPQSAYDQKVVVTAGGNQARAVSHHRVGTRGALDDRVYYYATNGATALTISTLCSVPATIGLNRHADHDNIAMTTSATNAVAPMSAGNDKVLYTNTDADADIITDEYADGYFCVQDVTGEGHAYKIRSHTEADASATSSVEGALFHLYDPIKVSLVATSQVSLARNKWDRVIAGAGAEEEAAVGINPVAIDASTALATDVTTTPASTNTSFFWMQTWGPCMVEPTGTAVLSGIAVTAGSTAKMVTASVDANNTMLEIGVGLQTVNTANDFILIDLRVCP
jgi:hypothetical protein